MESITITLRDGRSKEQVFDDFALYSGWPENIEEESTFVCNYKDLVMYGSAEAVLEANGILFTSVTSTQNISAEIHNIVYLRNVPNPVSQQQFGKIMLAKRFDELDTEAEISSYKKRIEKSNITSNIV